MEPLLSVRGLHKRYNVPVLVDFDFTLEGGEVHALLGGNGAGKSTFARILCGLTTAEQGEIRLNGHPWQPRARREAAAAGVVMVLQELSVLPTLSIAENLFLDRMPRRWGWIDRAELHRRAQRALTAVGLGALDPAMPAGALGVGQQQLLEIAAALAQDCRVLLLDEPTAALTAAETDELFARIHALKAQGVGIVYVSHRLHEIQRLADRVTILRDGRRVTTVPVAEGATADWLAWMTGGSVERAAAQRASAPLGPVLLDVHALRAGRAVRGVELTVRAGEVVGVAGLVGAGRTELLRAIYGADARETGRVTVDGRTVPIGDPAAAVAAGLGMVPEDRKAHGLLLPRSVGHNASLGSVARFVRRGRIDVRQEQAEVAARGERLALKCDSWDQPVAELSGGNQQKVVLARWLLRDVRVLLLDEPTRGIDVPAKRVVYELLATLAAEGKGVLLVSSETPELMAVCDRILVMSAGRLVAEFRPDDWSEEAIDRAAFPTEAHG